MQSWGGQISAHVEAEVEVKGLEFEVAVASDKDKKSVEDISETVDSVSNSSVVSTEVTRVDISSSYWGVVSSTILAVVVLILIGLVLVVFNWVLVVLVVAKTVEFNKFACGFSWKIAKGYLKADFDIVLTPD